MAANGFGAAGNLSLFSETVLSGADGAFNGFSKSGDCETILVVVII